MTGEQNAKQHSGIRKAPTTDSSLSSLPGLTPEQVQIAERAEKATPGPMHSAVCFVRDENDHDVLEVAQEWPWKKASGRPWSAEEETAGRQKRTVEEMEADADFYAAAREDIPALLRAVSEKAVELAALRAQVAGMKREKEWCFEFPNSTDKCGPYRSLDEAMRDSAYRKWKLVWRYKSIPVSEWADQPEGRAPQAEQKETA